MGGVDLQMLHPRCQLILQTEQCLPIAATNCHNISGQEKRLQQFDLPETRPLGQHRRTGIDGNGKYHQGLEERVQSAGRSVDTDSYLAS